jgi:hypothetical protein
LQAIWLHGTATAAGSLDGWSVSGEGAALLEKQIKADSTQKAWLLISLLLRGSLHHQVRFLRKLAPLGNLGLDVRVELTGGGPHSGGAISVESPKHIRGLQRLSDCRRRFFDDRARHIRGVTIKRTGLFG